MHNRLSIIALFAMLIFSPNCVMGQAGVSSMSSSALRAGLELSHEEIRVEELVNFHRHQIKLPAWNKPVSLETHCGKMSDGKQAFQIGLATHRGIVEEFRVPLNLVLVIDRSGSMGGDRIQKVKQSLLKLVRKLTPNDLISIVTYSDEASVCLETTSATDTESIDLAIRQIRVNGSTNLHAGLMKGYEIAKRNVERKKSSRVILLTDGLANRGVTEESEIARQSKTFNDQGIGLSTIGLGDSFNRSLLRELADAGRGAIHFVADANDIQKVFVDEFDSLLSPAAMDVSVTIRVPRGSKLPKIFGYKPEKNGDCYKIQMENMSYGATQVVVGKFGAKVPEQFEIELSFFDSIAQKKVVDRRTVMLSERDAADQMLKKNYSIAKLANAIQRSAKLAETGSFEKANKRLSKAISFVRNSYDSNADEDVDRVCQIATRQRDRICLIVKSADSLD